MNWQTPQELPGLRRVGIVALDTETRDAGLQAGRGSSWPWHDGHVCGISIAYRADGDIRALYIPLRHPDSDNFDPARVYRWLADLVASKTRTATLNGVYDWGWLHADGSIAMPPSDRLEEIGALATTVNENLFRYSLDALCETYGLPGKDEVLLREAVEAAGFVKGRKKVNAKEHIWRLPANARMALEFAHSAASLDPNFAQGCSALGLAHSVAGQHDEAVIRAARCRIAARRWGLSSFLGASSDIFWSG